jgi:hypothetical protein
VYLDQFSCARLRATRKLKEKLNFSKNPSKSAIQGMREQVQGSLIHHLNSYLFLLNCIDIGNGICIMYSPLIEES